jgi:hypothetical protein
MQLPKLLQPLQNEAARLFQDPNFVKKYVDTGVMALGYALIPLDAFMKHLLTVQGIDPNGNPNAELHQEISHLFTARHDAEYDSDYDVSWVHKKFQETRQKLGQLAMTQKKFMDLTDISRVDDAIASPFTIEPGEALVNQIAPECAKREIRVFAPEQERENLKEALQDVQDVATRLREEHGIFDPGSDAIGQLEDLIKKYSKKSAPPSKKSGVKTTKKKLNKKPQKIVRSDAKKAVEAAAEKAKLKTKTDSRAIETRVLVDDMIGRGLCSAENKDAQIADIMKIDDEAFDALKRVISYYTPSTRADASSLNFKGAFRRTS